MTTIWHNPRCSKSRQTLALLEANDIHPRVRLYLSDAPSVTELRDVIAALGMRASQLVRRGESVYRELRLDTSADETALIEAMAANPILIERPIVIHNGRAALGRPPDAVLELFNDR